MALELILSNRELSKLVYTLLVGLFCLIIVLRTHKLFKISSHQGIRYFRNAFFFYGFGFVARYILGTASPYVNNPQVFLSITRVIFEYSIAMAGFFLMYSLLWKRVEGSKSSLFNSKVSIFHALALIIAILDLIWGSYYFLFISQIAIFSLAFIMSLIGGSKKGFLGLYIFVIALNLISWIVNLFIATIFEWNLVGIVLIYLLNGVIFFLFLWAVLDATKK